MDGCGGHGLISVQDAFLALDAVPALPAGQASLVASLHRVLAAPARSQMDLPPFTQSAVDGYAVRHADLPTARLPVAGRVRAAALHELPQLAPATAQRIFTGACLPEGADTVVRQEHVCANEGAIELLRSVRRGSDVRTRAEELVAGSILAEPGTRLSPGLIGALAMGGVATVVVRRAPRVAVLVTGDEVVAPGATPGRGQIHDANGPLICAWLHAHGYVDVRLRYVSDAQDAVSAAIADALASADLVVTTGGVSVGDHDHVPQVARALGLRTLFWKVAQKPGKPVYAAIHNRVPLLGLPGNPASVLVNLVSYVRRTLDRLEGVLPPGPLLTCGQLEAPFAPESDRDAWVRVAVTVSGRGCIGLRSLPRQASHMLSNLAQATGLAWIPAGSATLPAGTPVKFLAL